MGRNQESANPPRYIDLGGLARLLPLSRRHISERVVKYKGFPAPRRIGSKRLWVETEVYEWIETKKEV